MKPIYRNIEFVSAAERLWGKIESGRYDWLGVKPDGDFVVGTPRAGRTGGSVSSTLTKYGAEAGRFGVRETAGPDATPDDTWYSSEDEARHAYSARLKTLREHTATPELRRIELRVEGRVADREFIVTAPSTYRGGNAPAHPSS